MYEEMGKLLSSLVSKFFKNVHVHKFSVENLKPKPIKELLKLGASKKEHVKSKVDIGTKAKTLFHSTFLSNDAKKVKFRDECFSFH